MNRLLPKNRSYNVLIFLFGSSLWFAHVHAQVPVREFNEAIYDSIVFHDYSIKKKIPDEIRAQALTALSFYPELRDIKLIFRFRKRTTPLSSRPRILSVFKKKKNRTYVITISTKTTSRLAPILFLNLPYNAQIGVLGHEIGHIAHYETKSSSQLLGLTFKILNPKFVDKFEYNTDRIAIEHGLGYQLYDWSTYVRKALNITVWKGAADSDITKDASLVSQRYMNPETIKKHIDLNRSYDEVK